MRKDRNLLINAKTRDKNGIDLCGQHVEKAAESLFDFRLPKARNHTMRIGTQSAVGYIDI